MKNLLFIALIAITSIVNAQKDKTYKSLDEAFKNPKEVYRLNLDWKKLGTITDSIELFTNLTYLRISSNELTEFPVSICKLTNLTELDISWNKITNLPDCISNLTKLEKLDAGQNKISVLPNSICSLANLTELNISGNKLKELPANIGNLSNLKKLDLASNNLESLPQSITKLTNATHIDFDFSFNRYKSLPEDITKMTNLDNIEQIKQKYAEFKEEAKYRAEQEEQERKMQEEIANFKYELNFDPNNFIDKETGEFKDEQEQYAKLPWKVEDIYKYLKTKSDFIYTAERYSLKEEKLTDKIDVGYKIEKKDDGTIESLMYNYSKKEYIKAGGMLAGMKDVISIDSIAPQMKFMPLRFMTIFRVVDEQETITIGKKKYVCTTVEGAFMFEKMKYWMVTDQPGLIVKIVMESTYNRKTWLLKKLK